MKTSLLFSLITFFLLFLSGCKKYDEGGRLGRADNVIVKNLWQVDKATDLEDGTDITADFAGEVWEFTEDDEYKKDGDLKGTYAFSDDKLSLIITDLEGDVDTYRILKMTKEEMWLEDIGSEEIHFEPY